MMAAVVTDASAAYLQRQGLDSLADGAALTAADAGASGAEVYGSGLGAHLRLDPARVRAAVSSYLRTVRAGTRYPGITSRIQVEPANGRVVVELDAPVRLPLHVPGSPTRAVIGATGAAQVAVDRP
jgi:hypothetical protein